MVAADVVMARGVALGFEECAHLLPQGLRYVRNALSAEEQANLLGDLESRSWTHVLNRRTQQCGCKFDWLTCSLSRSPDTDETLPPCLLSAGSFPTPLPNRWGPPGRGAHPPSALASRSPSLCTHLVTVLPAPN